MGLLAPNGQKTKKKLLEYPHSIPNLGTLMEDSTGSYFEIAKEAHDNKDYLKAIEYYLKAKEAGDSRAHYGLGILYMRGHGVEQDYVKGIECLQEAIAHGDVRAYHAIGVLYQYGHGMHQDATKAKEYFQKGAEMGDVLAQEALNHLMRKKH